MALDKLAEGKLVSDTDVQIIETKLPSIGNFLERI